jgi:LPS-assembly lipoprotein
MKNHITVCLLLLVLAACGWHPRGAHQLPPELQRLRVQSVPPDPQFGMRLNRALKFAGIELVEEAGSYTLTTKLERPDARNVSLDRSARSAEQERRLTLHFELHDPDGTLVYGPRTLSASRVYAYDPNNVIAKMDEEALIDGELADNLVAQVMRQLARVDTAASR